MDATNATSSPEQTDRNAVESAKSMDSKTLVNDILSTPSHSRSSSTGSNVSSPFASAFSTRSHSRWPSSASSLATNPDSPPLVAKSALHDLLEEPAERDEDFDFTTEVDALDEFCLCDSIFCEHRRVKYSSPGTPLESSLASIDHLLGLDEHAFDSASERRNSDGSSRGRTSRQLHHRLPSISRGWRRRKTTSSAPSASASVSGARSAPLSPSSSFRNLNWKYSITSHLQSPRSDAVRESSGSGIGSVLYEADILDDPFFLDLAEESMDQPRAPTPLLPFISPPLQPDGYAQPETTLPSPPPPPTQSNTTDYPFTSPLSCPTSPTLVRSPTLSTKPSSASIRTGISLHGADIPLSPTTSASQFDTWALKLGHANFHILPEPYLPALPPTTEICLRLREDWEAARVAFMRQAALIAEHYGSASRTYALTCEKWEEVDSQWRRNFEKACAEATPSTLEDRAPGVVGLQSPDLRPLPSTQVFLHMPLLSGDKFPAVDAADIVGPMVRYDSIEPPPHLHGQDAGGGGGRKGALLKLITDTASLLRKS